MENSNFVSLWLVKVNDEETLENVTSNIFNDDGDSVPSKFAELYEIGYNHDFSEIEYVGEKESIAEILDGFSYCDEIIPIFEQVKIDIKEFNSVILLYGLKYTGEKTDGIVGDCKFKFIGCAKYECE